MKTFGINFRDSTIDNFINKGVIYGREIAYVTCQSTVNGTNYGLFVEEVKPSNYISTKGLELKVNGENDYTLVRGEFGKEYSGENIEGIEYDIKNTQAEKEGDKIIGTESVTVNGEIKNTIYDGITDTVKIDGDVKFDNVTVNGYKSAIVFGENGGNLTLNNSVINGGVDREYDDEGNLLSNSSVIKGSENNDNLNTQEKNSINILDDISGAENILINENTTFFETLNIDGVKNIEIGEGNKESIGKINIISSETGKNSVMDMSGIDVLWNK